MNKQYSAIDFENAYVLAIGINSYNSSAGLPELKRAAKDAQDVAKLFSGKDTGGYKCENVVALVDKDAERVSILEHYKSLVGAANQDSLFVFFFAGHGGTDASGRYCLPLYGYAPEDPNTMLSEDDIVSMFQDLPAGRVLFIFDCCRAGMLSRAHEPLGDIASTVLRKHGVRTELIDRLLDTNSPASDSSTRGRVLLSSSMPEQLSYEPDSIENGLFTHCLLDALRGACQRQPSIYICIIDVINYLLGVVPEVANQYRVKQNCSVKASVLNANFPVCSSVSALKRRSQFVQLPERFVHAVLDLDEAHEKMEHEFMKSVFIDRELDSKFAYWGSLVTKKYVELMSSTEYSLASHTTMLLEENVKEIASIARDSKLPLRLISLGVGDGRKDVVLLKELLMSDAPIEYWIIDISYEMIRMGIDRIEGAFSRAAMDRVELRVFQMDFKNLAKIKRLLTSQKQNLFLLLGNTLGNFPEDTLLAMLQEAMNRGDLLLIDNQLKKPGPLSDDDRQRLKRMYGNEKHNEYIFAILARANIGPSDGRIETQITEGGTKNELIQGSATVNQQFIATENVKPGFKGKNYGTLSPGSIVRVIYSRKYVQEELVALIGSFFDIDRSYCIADEYALILAKAKTR